MNKIATSSSNPCTDSAPKLTAAMIPMSRNTLEVSYAKRDAYSLSPMSSSTAFLHSPWKIKPNLATARFWRCSWLTLTDGLSPLRTCLLNRRTGGRKDRTLWMTFCRTIYHRNCRLWLRRICRRRSWRWTRQRPIDLNWCRRGAWHRRSAMRPLRLEVSLCVSIREERCGAKDWNALRLFSSLTLVAWQFFRVILSPKSDGTLILDIHMHREFFFLILRITVCCLCLIVDLCLYSAWIDILISLRKDSIIRQYGYAEFVNLHMWNKFNFFFECHIELACLFLFPHFDAVRFLKPFRRTGKMPNLTQEA